MCFRDESARDVNGVAGFSRGECNGYIILKGNYLWDTLILASVPLFACAVSAAERRRRSRGMGVSHEVSECSVVIAKLVR